MAKKSPKISDRLFIALICTVPSLLPVIFTLATGAAVIVSINSDPYSDGIPAPWAMPIGMILGLGIWGGLIGILYKSASTIAAHQIAAWIVLIPVAIGSLLFDYVLWFYSNADRY